MFRSMTQVPVKAQCVLCRASRKSLQGIAMTALWLECCTVKGPLKGPQPLNPGRIGILSSQECKGCAVSGCIISAASPVPSLTRGLVLSLTHTKSSNPPKNSPQSLMTQGTVGPHKLMSSLLRDILTFQTLVSIFLYFHRRTPEPPDCWPYRYLS